MDLSWSFANLVAGSSLTAAEMAISYSWMELD
jgi:hypothetical protein